MNEYEDIYGNIFSEDELLEKAKQDNVPIEQYKVLKSIKLVKPKTEYKNIYTNKVINETDLINEIKSDGGYSIPNSGGKVDVEKYMYDKKIGRLSADGFGPSISNWDIKEDVFDNGVDIKNSFQTDQIDYEIDTEVDSLYDIPIEDFFKSDTIYIAKDIGFGNQGNFTENEYVNFLGEQSEKPAFQDELQTYTAMLNEKAVKQNKPKPTEDEIKEYTKNELIKKEKQRRKINQYSILSRESTEDQRAVISGIKTKNRSDIDIIVSDAANDFDVKSSGIEFQIDKLKESPEIKWIEDLVSDDNIFGTLNEGEYYFSLKRKDGKIKKIPSRFLDEYNYKSNIIDKKTEDIFGQRQMIIDEYKEVVNEDLISKATDLDSQINVLRRDYNNADKFWSTLALRSKITTLDIIDLIDFYPGIDAKQLELRIEQQKLSDKFSYNISFDDAFKSKENFGEFFLQEMATQIPIFAAMATTSIVTGGLGTLASAASVAGVAGISAFGAQQSDMEYEMFSSKENDFAFDDVKYTDKQMLWIPLGYGVAEGAFSGLPSGFLLSNGAKIMSGGVGRSIETGAFNYFKRNIVPGVVMPFAVESFSEGLTQASQNLVLDRPILENVGHAAFTGGMFGFGLGSWSVVSGAIASKFSDYKSYGEIRDISVQIAEELNSAKMEKDRYDSEINKLRPLQESSLNFGAKPPSLSSLSYAIKEINRKKDQVTQNTDLKVEELFNKQKELLKVVDKQIRDIGDAEFDSYASITSKQELLRNKFKELQDSFKSNEVKRRESIELKTEFDLLQQTRDNFRNVKEFGNIEREFILLESGNKKQRKKYNDLYEKAKQNLFLKSNKDKDGNIISDKQKTPIENLKNKDISDEALNIFIAEKVDASIAEAKSLEENQKYLNIKVTSFKTRKEATDKLTKDGNLSAAELVTTSNGFFKKRDKTDPNSRNEIILVRENMIENKRVGTGFHEVSHALLFESLALDTEQTKILANTIINWLSRTNRAAFTRMFMGIDRQGKEDLTMVVEHKQGNFIAEEVIVNFMEAVYNGQIDLTSVQNRTLTKVLGPIINNSLFRRTGIQKTIEWKGEQDMVNFITQMAKKLKDGTFTQEDFNAIRKDRTILKNENPTEIDKQYDIYNQSKITNNSNESSDDNKGVSKISKITADNLNRIYAENPGSTDIIFEVGTELMTTKALDDKGNIKVISGDGFIGKLVDKRRGVPKFNEKREEIMFEAAYGDISGEDAYKKGRNKNTGIPDLIRTYNPNEENMSFAAYIYAILPFRVNGIANFHLDANENNYSVSLSEEGSDFLSNYSESLITTQEDVSESEDSKAEESNRLLGLFDPRDLITDPKLRQTAINNINERLNNLDPGILTFANLEDLSEETTAELFNIPVNKLITLKSNPNDLTQSQLRNVLIGISEIAEQFIKILPNGANISSEVSVSVFGRATGLPNTVLNSFYEKRGRKDNSGKSINLNAYVPKNNLKKEDVFLAIGLESDGVVPPIELIKTRIGVQSAEARTAKQIAKLIGKLITNTTVRETLDQEIKTNQMVANIQNIAAGKSEYMLSAISIHGNMWGKRGKHFHDQLDNFISDIDNNLGVETSFIKYYDSFFVSNRDKVLQNFLNLEKKWEKNDEGLTLGKYILKDIRSTYVRTPIMAILNLPETAVDFTSEDQLFNARIWLKEFIKSNFSKQEAISIFMPMVSKASGNVFDIKDKDNKVSKVSFDSIDTVKDFSTEGKRTYVYHLSGSKNDFIKNFLEGEYGIFDSTGKAIRNEKSVALIQGEKYKTRSTNKIQRFTKKFFEEEFQTRVDQVNEQRVYLNKIYTLLKQEFEKINEEGNEENLNLFKNNLGMFMITLGSNSDALIKTAAMPGLKMKDHKYDVSPRGLKEYRYEHTKPARQVIQDLLLDIIGETTEGFDAIMKDYRVAIIPVTHDTEINKHYRDTVPLDDSGKAIPNIVKDNDDIEIARYIDPGVLQSLKEKDLEPFVLVDIYKQSSIVTEAPLSDKFNDIIENVKGISSDQTFSDAFAFAKGNKVSKYEFFVPPSADDFMGLMYSFLGKGSAGDLQKQFFEDVLNGPYKKGIANIDSAKQKMENDYRELKKKFPEVAKRLSKKIPGMEYTYDQAVRIFLWKYSYKDASKLTDIVGLSASEINTLFFTIAKDQELQQFARGLGKITGLPSGYIEPSREWQVETIASDLNHIIEKVKRKDFLSKFIENKNEIFNKENLNKIEVAYGSDFREALEDSLYAMENGTSRNFGKNKIANQFSDWLSGSVGAIMFFNARSAALQLISNVNYLNWSDNNFLQAGKAFANQKQYWSDFVMIIKSDKLKQRRKGLNVDVQAAELISSVNNSTSKYKSALNYLLRIGFLPTQAADATAIALGGATFYRNRVNTYENQGMETAEAEKKAFEDFSEITDASQQSADPSRISQQQRNPFTRWFLAFQNTAMQYNRIIKKSYLDLVNKRGDAKSNISKIIYYGTVQNLIFNAAQQAMFAVLFDDDEENPIESDFWRLGNGMADSILKGSGWQGAVISTLKNTILQYQKEEKKGSFKADHLNTAITLLNVAPSVGSKFRKVYGAYKTNYYERDVIKEKGFAWDSPRYDVYGSLIEATTNIPAQRLVRKINNISLASKSYVNGWQKVALLAGWSAWDLNIQNKEHELIKTKGAEERKKAGIEKAKETRKKNYVAKPKPAPKPPLSAFDKAKKRRDNLIKKSNL